MTTIEVSSRDPQPRRGGGPSAPTVSPPRKPRPRRRAPEWLLPTGLVVLSLVPIVAGSLRLASLTGAVDAGALGTPPGPTAALVAHIVGVTVYVLLGAFQFHRGLRRRRPRWHRIAGRVTAPAGLVAAGSGMWLAVTAVGPHGTATFVVLRLVVGAAMATAIILGVRAVLARDIGTHRAWMTRAYAIAQGAGTQALVLTVATLVLGELGTVTEAALFAASWAINLVIAEWAIRRG